MADDTTPAAWKLAPRTPFTGIPFTGTYGGQASPYADSTAQVLDAMRISGLLSPTPDNPLMTRTAGYKPGDAWSWNPSGPHEAAPNQAGRYSFGGGGGYGGAFGLLGGGRVATPGGFGPGGGTPQPGAPGSGFVTPKVAVDGTAFTGGGNPNVNPGAAAFAQQAQGYARPATAPTPTQEQLAQIAGVGGPQSQAAQQQLYSQLGPMGYAQLMGAIQPQGSGSLLNPSRSAAVSQLAGGMTPQQVASHFGAAAGDYYNLDGTSTGANPGAAPLGSTAPGTSLAYLTQIAGLLGAPK